MDQLILGQLLHVGAGSGYQLPGLDKLGPAQGIRQFEIVHQS